MQAEQLKQGGSPSAREELEAGRLGGQGRFVGMLAEHGHLRPDVSVEHARDVVWTLCSLAVHDLLVVARGWTEGRYQDWLATVMARELLAPPQGG